MTKKRHAKVNIFMCAAAVLLCATLFSTHLVGGLYAKYTTTATSTNDARVAKFSITQSFLKDGSELSDIIKAEIKPGSTQSVHLKIENNSEVAVEYTIKLTNVTGNLPTLKMKLSPVGDTPEAALLSEGNGDVEYSAIQKAPGNHTDEYTLDIVWEPTSNDLDYIGMVDYITISVTAAQID